MSSKSNIEWTDATFNPCVPVHLITRKRALMWH